MKIFSIIALIAVSTCFTTMAEARYVAPSPPVFRAPPPVFRAPTPVYRPVTTTRTIYMPTIIYTNTGYSAAKSGRTCRYETINKVKEIKCYDAHELPAAQPTKKVSRKNKNKNKN